MGFIFGGDTGQTQADVTDARKRLAAAMLQQGTDTSPIQSPWEGAARMAQALMGGLAVRNQASQQRAADAQVIAAITGQPYTPPEQPKGFLSSLFGGGNKPANPGATGSSMPKVDASGNIAATPTSSELPSSFLAAVDRTEGAGDYDTLFGHAQKDGPFAGTSVSSMPIRDVIAFTDPSGPYAQYVKGKVGHVATPVGKYQTVGTTIRGAVEALGLDPNAPYDRATQDRVASYLARQRIASADTLPGKIQALRAEWQGFKNVPDAEMAQIVADLESGAVSSPAGTQVASAGPVAPPAAPIQPPPVNPPAPPTPAVAPGEVASLDPSVGIPMPGAAGQMRASDPAQIMPPQAGPQAALPPLPTSRVGPTPPVASVPPVDQQQPAPVRLAQALDNAPQQAPNPMANPRVQALVQAIMNPNASPQVKALAAQQLQVLTRPPEYGFETMADGTILRTDPRTGTVQPIYQAPAKPVEVNGRLIDPSTGRVIVDFGNGDWEKGDNGALFNKKTGEIRSPQTLGGSFRFSGNSVEAQALNGLMESGQLTPEQAQQLGAGKTISGPNGEIIFLTPQGIFSKPANAPAQPVTPNPQTPPAQPGSDQPPAAQAPQQTPDANGNIQITKPKVTIDESKAAGFADRMAAAEAILGKYGSAGLGVKDQFVSDNNWIPDAAENWMLSNDFQNFAQARRNFINSQLRRESGAVISPEEFTNANKQYFPVPGDNEEVLKQKAANRKAVIDAMIRDAGPTYKRPEVDSDQGWTEIAPGVRVRKVN
ncbi:hypothetical protein [Rhizobium bangladeshense]|uniref:hypothetical protein n=1 Tax=Rhizobium bangladeshense TaxID=1138189 RepID=UPI0021B11F67|nr:hypothetical protein [Rhizobium bangladeshense]